MTSHRPAPVLLCAAESWGFGPAAKLFAILRLLRPKPKLVVAGTGSTAAFARLNAGIVDEIIVLDSPYDILSMDVRFDAVLTVMDPWAALLGARRGVPVSYVDSLSWFWQWDDIDFGTVDATAKQWLTAELDEIRAIVARPVNWHEIVPMAYHWSTRVFAQRAPGVENRAALYPENRVQAVGAVIATTMQPSRAAGPALVSVSGAVSHATPQPVAARYAQMVRVLLTNVGAAFAGATVTGNPVLLDVFRAGPWRVRELAMSAMHQELRRASFLLAPAGLTTAFEAAAVGTPMVFLPEQHGGHSSNVDLLTADDHEAYDDILLRRWFGQTPSDPHQAIDDLDHIYRRIIADKEPVLLADMVATVRTAAASLRDPGVRAERVARQRANVLQIVGDFDGAQTVAQHCSGITG